MQLCVSLALCWYVQATHLEHNLFMCKEGKKEHDACPERERVRERESQRESQKETERK